jgi:hypothetical protein
MTNLFEASDFLLAARKKLRFGTFSREPLSLLRVEWTGDRVACDWLMRASDLWDKYVPDQVARENQTLQSLRDALNLREAVFKSFPTVMYADLRMFREGADHQLELLMTGTISRTNEVPHRVPSVTMRAKLCGFKFTLADGALKSLVPASMW